MTFCDKAVVVYDNLMHDRSCILYNKTVCRLFSLTNSESLNWAEKKNFLSPLSLVSHERLILFLLYIKHKEKLDNLDIFWLYLFEIAL